MPERLLRPAPWAIRTCPERDVITSLTCWYHPSIQVTGDDAEARATIGEALAKWRESGLPFVEDVEGARSYDPEEVINFAIVASLLGRDGFWASHVVPLQIDMLQWFAGKPLNWEEVPDFRSMPERGCRVEFERTYFPPAESAGGRLRLKLPLPLASPHFKVERLELRSPGEGPIRTQGSRGELLITQGNVRPVSLAFSASASALPDLGTAGELTPDDRTMYTARKEGLVVVSPAVEDLAEQLAAGERDHAVLAHRFYRHLIDHYVHGRVAYRAIDSRHPTDWPLKEGFFDCQLGAALLIGLCRARDIPARLVNGYQIFHAHQGNHFWAEIWLDGLWRPYDLSSWDVIRIHGGEIWRSSFAGQTEYRLPLQRFPRDVLGPASVGLGPAWQQLHFHDGSATVTQYREAYSQRPIYQDTVSVEWAPSEVMQGPEAE
jgi:hypothetical protein